MKLEISTEGLKIQITSLEDITMVKFIGDLNGSNSAVARHKLSPISREGGKFILDLTEVAYTSSAGLVLLYSTYKDILSSGGKMALFQPQNDVRKALVITGFSDHIPIFDNLDLAVAELKK